jgi:predicted kinase
MRKVIVMRGISGAGKSTFVKTFLPEARVVSADHYHIEPDGTYSYKPSEAGRAHAACLRAFVDALTQEAQRNTPGDQIIVVDNTNTTVAEIAPYMAMARAYGFHAEIITLRVNPSEGAKRNLHGVTQEIAEKQHANLESAEKDFPDWWKHIVR